MRTFVTSERAASRLERARAFLKGCERSAPLLIVASSPEAGSELVRSLTLPAFGWRRLSLFRAAAELARPALLAQGRALAAGLTLDALWARVVFTLAERRQLGRFEPLAERPGLSRALAQSVAEARELGLSPEALEPGLAAAMHEFAAALDEQHLADRALVFELAIEAVHEPHPVLLLDVAPEPGLETRFLEALAARASRVCVTLPGADEGAVARVSQALGVPAEVLVEEGPSTPLRALQHNLFTTREVSGEHAFDDLFSAPGEARECVEIARRILEASKQTPFDRMAVLLRSPSTYRAPLEDAFRRAKIPAYFASGIPRPDPSGRALLALLKCAEESLSARRFSEYLSLGQVPKVDAAGAPPAAAPEAERFARAESDSLLPPDDKVPLARVPTDEEEPLEPDAPVTAGQLRAPRRWERLIIDAAVIGGVDRWRRRLQGLERKNLEARQAPTLTEANQQRLERELGDLQALGAFALPLLDALAALPRAAKWQEWIDQLSSLASRALRHPRRVQAVLRELSPMGPVGPVELREVRAVLTQRLSELTEPPEGRRYGQVFVAPVEQARGLSFELVFVPGLAERIFPQKVREDPLLPDATRQAIDPRLETNAQRVARERVALRLAVGAAESRAVLSWPRIDAEHARPRVPSFYALEAARAVQGSLPAYEELQRKAEQSGRARLAWPAPRLASSAIDDIEYDLAVLDQIISAEPDQMKGRARYLVEVSPHLARALRSRYARWNQSSWTFADGLVRPDGQARKALEGHQLSARPYSPTALEQYAACPYRFFLSAIHRLSPLEIPDEIEELGPLEKGSMTHAVQYRLLSGLREEGVKVTEQTLALVFKRLDAVIAAVTAEYADDFVPAIERVWNDGIEVMRADLREWLRKVSQDTEWEPWRFELSFGLPNREDQDPSSVPTPVPLTQGVQLRGSIDLVEKSVKGHLRATDYKTGKARADEDNVVGGGRHMQPVLYALVLEKLFPELAIDGGQLFYCTQVGGFKKVPTPLDTLARESLGRVMLAIRKALEEGFFPAMPDEGECRWCDFRPICGPEEERRIRQSRKGLRAETRELLALRDLP